MDAFGYQTAADGNRQFVWIVRDAGQVLRLSGQFGRVYYDFETVGYSPEDWNAAVNLERQRGFVFDFNEKCRELLVCFPLSGIADLQQFRFEKAEPALHYALQQSGNGFCDYAFCDSGFLNFLPWVYQAQTAVGTICKILELENIPINDMQIWASEKGVPQQQLWPQR